MALDQTTLNGATVFKDTKTDTATNEVVVTTYDENFEIIGVEKKDAGGTTLFKSEITADTTGFSAAAEVASGAALTLGGDKAAGGKVTNTAEEKVTITSAGDDSGMAFDVVGTNAAGAVVTERVTGANDGTATTSAGFLEVTSITAVGDPAGTVSVAGEGYKEVVKQTETRKEQNDAGEIVDKTFSVEKTINYDGGAKIKSGTEKIDGKEKTLGENGVVTAETMDPTKLGDAATGDTLAAVAARYDAVAANAEIYVESENLGGGVSVTTLYDENGLTVGSSDTSVETFGDMTLTVTNHFAAPVTDAAGEIVAGEYIGTSGTDGTNTWDFTKTEVTTDSGMSYDVTFTNTPAYKETGSESYGGETRSFTYFFNKATGELLSGTEVVDGITTTFGANWLITAEAMDPADLGVALASTVLDDLPASVKAATGNTYSKTESFDWGGGETTYFNAQGATTGFAYTWADASGNSNNSYYDAQDNYVGDSWSDAEGRSGSSSVAIANDGSKVETGSYADTNNSSDDSSWTYNFNADGEMTGGSEVRGATTTTLGANWSVSGKQVAVGGLSQLNLDNVDDNVEAAFFTIDADGISASADVGNNAALVIGGALSAGGVATNVVAASVSIASAGNDSAISFTVVGTNAADAALTETVTGSNAGIALSAGEFKTITSVTAVGDPAGKVTVGSRHTTIYESTETFDWGGSLTTLLDASGAIKGYADSYSDDWDGDGNVDSSGTTYMLSDWSYAGSEWSDSWGTGEQWAATLAADGSELASGQTREFGKNSWSDGSGGQETREYDYTWDSNYNLVEGKETGSDGVTTIYGANWSITSQKGDTTKLGDALTTAELAGVPTSIQSALTNAETYAKTSVYDWGTDTTYYDSNGTILGYANASSWDMDDGSSNTNKSYHDANWNWLGGSWADKDANGAIIRSGSNSTVNTYTDVTNTLKASFIDSGSYREGDEGSSYSWTFNVTYDANGYEIHEMDGGTEVRGTYNASGVLVGTTYTYGPDWVLQGAQADTSNLATLDLSTLDASLVTALFGSADAVIKYSTESFDWNQGFSQSTYYDANDAIVGYGDSWSDDWDGDGTVDSTGQSFMDAKWNYVGGSYNDEYGSGHNFTIKTDADLDSISVDAAVANNGVLVIGGALASSGSITHTVAQKVAISSSGDDSNISFTVVGTDAAGAALTETVMGANAGTASSGSLFLTITSITAVGDPAANVSVGTMKTIQEIGENTWSDYDGNDQTNKYDFTYDADYNLMAGSEERGQKGADGTLSGGETVTYGANWEVLSVSRDVNLSSEAISELSSTDLAGIPSALHAAVGATYAETEVNPWGNSTTYLDSDGQILGYSDAWTEAWGSGTNYQDADWNHLGSTYDDEWSTGFHHTVESTLNGNKVYIETGSRTEKNADGSLGEVTTNEFIFDENWNMISGTETRGSTTTTFVENWVIFSQETNMDDVGTVNVSGLPASVQTLLFTGETLTAVKATVETFPWGGSQTTYYDTNGVVLGYMDTYVDDFSGSSGTSFMDDNWNHIGGTYVDEWGSGSNFTVKTSADIDSVSAAAAVADGGSLVIGGALAAGGSVTHAAAQKVTISSTGDDSGITFTVVGTDEKGEALTETVTGANADMAVSQKSFLTITGITAGGDPAANVSVGTLEVIVESGTSSWTNYADVVESRSFSFSYDENYNLLAGTETTSDDTTITWGAGWTQLASQISVTGMIALNSDQLDDLPTPLKAAVGDTYAKIQDWGYGSKQTTYLDGAGNILGYHDSWDDDYGSGSSYMDANWNHLGGSNASKDGNYSSSSFREISFDSISVSEEVANNGALVLAGSLTDGTFALTDAHKVTITSAGNDAARTFRVVGTDGNDAALVEVVTGANAGTATSTAAFLTVTSITAVGDPAGKVSASFEGIEKEVGTNSWKEGEGANQVTNTSSYAFNYDASGTMIGGTEIRPDLTTVKFGANWAFLGEQIDTSTALVLSDSDVDGISTLASVADNADLVIGGALAQAGAVTHTAAQIVTIKSVGNDSGISFEVFGTNAAGIATTETVTGANAGTATTAGEFLTITKITMTGAANGQVSAGTAGMKAGIPSAVLSTLNDGVTKYIDVPHGDHGQGASSGFERTFLDSDGSILGYMNTFSEDWNGDNVVDFSGKDFMDANWNWLGGTGSDDWMQWSNSTVDALDGNNAKIGTIETRTETEKNYNGNDPAGVYTGQQRITVTEYDLDLMMVTRTETTTLDSGDKLEFVFNSNFEIIAEYTYELVGGSYQKLITDKYALFQLEKFSMQDEYLKGYALDQGYTNLVDGDGDGEIDIYVEDNDGDGVGDLVSSFTRAMMDATVFAGAAGGEPTITLKDNKIESLMFTSNGLKMVLMGDFTLKTASEIAALHADDRSGPDMIAKGTVTASYVYDTANSDALVGYADTLNINFLDIYSFMTARSTFNIGSSQSAVGMDYEIHDDGVDHANDNTKTSTVDNALKAALSTAGFNVDAITADVTDITKEMIEALQQAEPDYEAPPAIRSLTDMMGGSSAFADIASSHGSDAMGMGGEQRYDAMGNNINVIDDGFGNITEMMVDPANPDIQIKTEYLANGDVVLTQLITDGFGVVTEVAMGSGSKVEGQYFDEISTVTNGLAVTEREYDMSNVYLKVAVDEATGAKTETSKDARGYESEFVSAADNSFVETIKTPDGKTSIAKAVDQFGGMTITQTVKNSEGDDVITTVGRGTSIAVEGGGRIDMTIKNDGSKSVINVAANGDETLESYTATVSEEFMSALTDAGWGAAVVASVSPAGPATFVAAPNPPFNPLETVYTTAVTGDHTTEVATIDVGFFDYLLSAGFDTTGIDSFSAIPITTAMIIAVGGSAAPVSAIVAAPALPAIDDAVTAEMVAALVTAGLLAEPTYTLAATNESKTLEDGSTQQTTTVGSQKVITTHTVQDDGSLKAVSKTEGGTTLKEQITTYDAAGLPTVTAKEYLGQNHTRVTVSDAETQTVVTEQAGAVTKAVKDIAADKTVTTTVDANKDVVVTEQTGTAPAVTTATGTLTVLASGQYEGQETLDLITQDAAGNVTGAQEITVFAGGGERTKVFDALGNQQSNQQVYEYHDGTVWTEAIVDGVAIQTYTYTNGETETLTLDEDTGAITVTQKLLVGGSLVETAKAAGTETLADGFLTQTFDLGGGEFEVRVYENATGIEETTFKTMNGSGGFDITKVLKEVRDENGNDIVTEQTYTMVNNVATLAGTVETVISVDGTAQEKEVSATGEITLKEGGIDGLGNAYEKVLGTGTSEVVNGETINTITLADNSTVTEKYDANNNMVQKTVADQAGDSKVSTFTGGEETIAYSDALGETIDASEVDIKLDIGFANADLGFVNLDYADMASGFTSQAGDFDMSIDYSNTELATAEGGYGGASSAGSSGHGNETTNTLGYNGTNNSTNNNDGPAEDLTAFSSYFSESFNDDAPAVPDFY